MDPFRNKTSIAGIGWTRFSANSERSVLDLALEACQKAIEDAGIPIEEVDGVLSFNFGDSVPSMAVANGLGLPNVRYCLEFAEGGNAGSVTVATAAMAVITGMAKNVVVFRAMNGRSGLRLGGSGQDMLGSRGPLQFTAPYGWISYPQAMAMWCRRHMIEYGTTSRQLGAVAVACRKHAALNERAMKREPITIEDHQASRWIVEPFRLLDICLESDGACAVLVTSRERARDLRHRPVQIAAAAYGGGPMPGDDLFDGLRWRDHAENYAHYIGDELFGRAGIERSDLDFAEIYDCFTYSVIMQLEGFGICAPGEAASFVQDGRIELGGKFPINTHGGLLSEAYIHGFNHITEAVSQLRGDAGERQVSGAETALVTSGAMTVGSALILTV